jgi:UDP-N-acetylglucosamine/UDP-N-acetylgalactosamine diphosphorylase
LLTFPLIYIPTFQIEKFVFDAFPLAESFACWEVLREDEFSPLKNRPGASADTPQTARNALISYYHRLVSSSGGTVVDDKGQELQVLNGNNSACDSSAVVEISPLVSYRGEGLASLVANKRLKSPLLLNSREGLLVNGSDHAKKIVNNDLLYSSANEKVH